MENDVNLQQAALMRAPKTVLIFAEDGKTVVATMRQFNMDELLDPELGNDLMSIWTLVQEKLKGMADAGEYVQLCQEIIHTLPVARKRLQQCLDVPLASFGIDFMADIAQAFVLANFTERLRKSLAALGQQRTNPQVTQNLSNSTSATPSSSSSTTDTTAGGTTPATSSNSGSGAA